MNKLIFLILLFVSVDSFAGNKVHDNEVIEFHKSLRCLVCDGQSVYDSDSEFSIDIKEQTSLMLKEGKSLKDVEEFFVDVYGDSILFAPKFNLANFLIWVLPYILIAIFGISYFRR